MIPPPPLCGAYYLAAILYAGMERAEDLSMEPDGLGALTKEDAAAIYVYVAYNHAGGAVLMSSYVSRLRARPPPLDITGALNQIG